MSELIPGEHINTSQMRGTNQAQSGAWSDWAIQRLPDMRTLHEAGLSGRTNEWGNVIEHSLVVNATAVFLGEKLVRAGATIDIETVDTASLVHDAAKRHEKIKGVSYAAEHHHPELQGMLFGAGYSPRVITAARYTGRVPTVFEDVREQEGAIATRPLEDLVVAYADARVSNTNIVSLEEARERNKVKVPADTAFYEEKWYPFYTRVEDQLIDTVGDPDFTPASINNDAVRAMVREATLLA